MRHLRSWVVPLAGMLLGGCSLMGFFEEPPSEPCPVPGQERTVANSCGVCMAGGTVNVCGDDGAWEIGACTSTIDVDGDLVPNAGCDDLTDGCCTELRDCNDADPEVHPETFVCLAGATGEPCDTDCGSVGTRDCTDDCVWGGCVPPDEECNGEDDDCDTEIDETYACLEGETVACRTTCDVAAGRGATGTGTCTGTCEPPAPADCVPPGEVCDGQDNNCDGRSDEGEDCIRGASVSCSTACGGTVGTGRCSDECTAPGPADCTPPDEICNGLDDDCDTIPDRPTFTCTRGMNVRCTTTCGSFSDSGVCTDSCGIPAPADCPIGYELCDNDIDDDCDTTTDELDPDQCTPGDTVACATACDPAGDTTGTGICRDDCGLPVPDDCTPPAEECSGHDDDCDGAVDEDFTCVAGRSGIECTTTCGTLGLGTCTSTCEIPAPADCTPPAEICNGNDDDCDGTCDDGFGCCAGSTVACTTSCSSAGTLLCSDSCVLGACVPPVESCNGLDDDCDGETDEDFPCAVGTTVACTLSCGRPGTGTCTSACAVPDAAACTAPAESCNGIDDDCDTVVDESLPCAAGATTSCITTCGSTGSGLCTALCSVPLPADCTPPAELCNGLDDDCDTLTDDGFDCVQSDPTSCTTSCATTGTGTCTTSCAFPAPAFCTPPAELCNALDDDCVSGPDNGFPCVRGTSTSCSTTCGSTGAGSCTTACAIPAPAACTPPAETCNGVDDDCVSGPDNGFPCVRGSAVSCSTTCGSTGSGTCTTACAVPAPALCSPPAEVCNALDDDCVSGPDNGFPCVRGSAVSCSTSCGSSGSGTCTTTCAIPGAAACTPPAESCNGVDDDCVSGPDNGFACVRGSAVSCSTTCGSTGSGTCTTACAVPAPALCAPPAETCNGLDDDCVSGADNGFPCVRGASTACTTTCGSTGSGTCTTACAIPAPATCTPPVEVCNGADDDCVSGPDNGFPCVRGNPTSCTTTCGSTGTGTCTTGCAIPAPALCAPPAESCNGLDDDCVSGCDNGFACCRGTSVACTSTCGTTGTGTCTAACAIPAPALCTPPAESCNAVDDDCDASTDETFACARGSTVACTTTCGTTGTGTCTTACAIPAPADCTPPAELCNGADEDCDTLIDETFTPAAPQGLWPDNGTRTGTHRVAANLQPTFEWSAVSVSGCPALRYELQLDDSCTTPGFASCTFPSPVAGTSALASTTYTPPSALPTDASAPYGRRYYWRVRACTTWGRCGAWSAVRYLDVGREVNDFNGDGYADLLVGALRWDGAANIRGRAYIFLGGSPMNATADLTMTATNAGDAFGTATAGIGDVNGDGFADWLIGQPQYDPGGTVSNGGRAQVFFGGSTLNGTADLTTDGTDTFETLGSAVGAAGDVNADGYADWLIGCPNYNTQWGRAFAFYGGAAPDGVADVNLTTTDGGEFGYSVAGAGDFDADGFGDILVGARAYGSGAGAVSIYWGGSPFPGTSLRYVCSGTAACGYSVSTAGDFNGDRRTDIAFAQRGLNAARVSWGGAREFTPDVTLTVASAAAMVGAIGDADNDGFDDIVVGDPDNDVGFTNSGTLFLFRGTTGAAPAAASSSGGANFDVLGSSVAGVGDANADGFDDAVGGAPSTSAGPTGFARLLWGSGSPYWTTSLLFTGEGATQRFGCSVGATSP